MLAGNNGAKSQMKKATAFWRFRREPSSAYHTKVQLAV